MGMALALCFFHTGCGIGGYSMTGMVLEKDLKSIKPYIAYWAKDGMTEERRLQDWVGCGGDNIGTFSWKTKKQMPGESNEQSSRRQDNDLQRCMLRSGYRYTGKCSSADMKAQPLCGAP